MNAYDYFLQGRKVLNDPTKVTVEGNNEARLLFEKAIELDPKFSRAYVELAYLFVREYEEGWGQDPTSSLEKAEERAKQALAINDDVYGHWHLALVYGNQGEFDKSFVEYEIAHKLDPQHPDLAADMGETLIYSGEFDRAITVIKEAMNRKIPYCYWWNLGRAYYMSKRYQEAIDAIAKITDPPDDVLLITAASKAQLGNVEGARTDIAEFSKNVPDWSIAKAAERYFRNDSDRQHWLDGLRKAGLKEK
jgi:tetratricopeptide (TPR) repeat protein